MTEDMEQVKEWERIAQRILHDPKASRSEVTTALIGITRSKDAALREALEEKKLKAWKADTNVVNKISR